MAKKNPLTARKFYETLWQCESSTLSGRRMLIVTLRAVRSRPKRRDSRLN